VIILRVASVKRTAAAVVVVFALVKQALDY